jgi:hypothetical protein
MQLRCRAGEAALAGDDSEDLELAIVHNSSSHAINRITS